MALPSTLYISKPNAQRMNERAVMKNVLTLTATILAFASPAFADSDSIGDPEAGAKDFRKCKACHTVNAPDGTVILKGGKTGPNLYGVMGRIAGSEDFKYSPIMMAAGEAGLIWDVESLEAYLLDPNAYLAEVSGESGRSRMTKQRVKSAADIAAYLDSLVQ